MKSVMNSPAQLKPKPFPKMMVHETSGVVVLFTSPKIGTVVYVDASAQSRVSESTILGQNTSLWSPREFSDFRGTITLEN